MVARRNWKKWQGQSIIKLKNGNYRIWVKHRKKYLLLDKRYRDPSKVNKKEPQGYVIFRAEGSNPSPKANQLGIRNFFSTVELGQARFPYRTTLRSLLNKLNRILNLGGDFSLYYDRWSYRYQKILTFDGFYNDIEQDIEESS